ncbi:MAG TPA: adenosine kinase, partial [Acidimicrobiales bacterium]|nr:adenosine kinase [Acidimicrobiales bacterium]
AEALYGEMPPGIESSGGSAANTMAGIASLGGRAAFIGKVFDDELGAVFAHDIRASGVHFATAAASSGEPTARCLILVTPDAQRTMNTFLGAAAELGPDDVDLDLVASAEVTYLEGYLWEPPPAKAAFRKAMDAAHAAGRRVALTLSDSFVVHRSRGELLSLVQHDVDILFANEAEITALYDTDFDRAVAMVQDECEVAALTRSEQGSVVVMGGEVIAVPAHAVDSVVDTTGAGDLYAAGFLHALTTGGDAQHCGALGALCAAEIISHVGARPFKDLKALADQL